MPDIVNIKLKMVQAKYSDKARIVEILTSSFLNNQSVNYIVKQGPKREQRIKSLMSYSFDMCKIFGDPNFATACKIVEKSSA
jgi:hypothetical protein